jgi:nucleotide-binding universal stress UspA family protein
MFHRILIPTDFSTASEWVFDDAVRIAAASAGEIIILHVRMTWADHPDELRLPADPALYEYVERLELEKLRERVRESSLVKTSLIVRQAPDPGDEICRTATREKADLIVIATHARHHVAHLIVGSTTVSVLTDPPTPVLAIRYGIRKRKQQLNRIVVPVHLEQDSRAALELAAQVGREVHILTVCDDAARTRAEQLHRQLAESIPNAKTQIVKGTHAQKEIVKYTTKVDADAIFLNAHNEPSEGKLDIIRHAEVPVMIVPSPSPK